MFYRSSALVCGVLVGLLLASCSDSSSPGAGSSTISLADKSFIVMSGNVSKGDNGITGAGTIASSTPYAFEEGVRYKVTFTLEDGGSIAILSNGGTGLSGALEVVATRSGNSFSVVKATSPQGKTEVWTDFINQQNLSLSEPITLWIDIHNEGATGVIVTAAGVEAGEEQEKSFEELSGRNWGIRLDNSKLISVDIEEAHHEH